MLRVCWKCQQTTTTSLSPPSSLATSILLKALQPLPSPMTTIQFLIPLLTTLIFLSSPLTFRQHPSPLSKRTPSLRCVTIHLELVCSMVCRDASLSFLLNWEYSILFNLSKYRMLSERCITSAMYISCSFPPSHWKNRTLICQRHFLTPLNLPETQQSLVTTSASLLSCLRVSHLQEFLSSARIVNILSEDMLQQWRHILKFCRYYFSSIFWSACAQEMLFQALLASILDIPEFFTRTEALYQSCATFMVLSGLLGVSMLLGVCLLCLLASRIHRTAVLAHTTTLESVIKDHDSRYGLRDFLKPPFQ